MKMKLSIRSPAAAVVLVVCAACPGPSAEPGEGEGEGEGEPNVVTTHVYRLDETQQTRLVSTVHEDGSVALHGETVLDFSAQIGGEAMRAVAVETAQLDTAGRLIHADRQLQLTFADLSIAHHEVIDAAAGTVEVSRPNGRVQTTWPTDGAWVPLTTQVHPLLGLPLPSALACTVLERAYDGSPSIFFVDPGLTVALPFPGAGTGAVSPRLFISGIACDFDTTTGTLLRLTDGAGEVFADAGEGAALADDPAVPVLTSTPIELSPCDETLRAEPVVANASDGRTLSGEIDLPEGDGPFPVVVFSAGTGGSDRAGAYFGTPQWRCLAVALNAQGIAAVRWDETGFGDSAGVFAELTFADRTAHVVAIAEEVAARADVRSDGLFLLGHSEGAWHSFEAAAAVAAVDGVISAAGVGSSGADALQEQGRALFTNAGYAPLTVSSLTAQTRAFVDAVVDGTFEGSTAAGMPLAFWEQFFAANGATDAIAAAKPTLVLQGGSDWQVTPQNADRLEEALTGAAIAVDVVRVPDLGHFFTHNPPSASGVGEEYGVPLPWDPRIVDAIVDWVHARAPALG